MSVLKALRDRVAPELNHLYTELPRETPAGVECGWRGHEHALHAFLVARMFGAEAALCVGDYAILSRFLPPLTTIDREANHAWCIVNGVAPIDLAMTFATFGQAPQLRNAIVGEGRNGDWEVQYAEDESPMDEGFSNRNEIIFVERDVPDLSAATLLESPLQFLPAASAENDPANWPARHGPAIFAQITAHCFACASGTAKSVRPRFDREAALAWIAANYPDAEKQILAKLV